MLDLSGPWNRKHYRRTPEQPSECDLRRRGVGFGCDARDRAVRASEFAGSQWEPGYETDFVLLAVFKNSFGAAVTDAVAVLYSDNVDDFAGVFNLLDADFRYADVTDFSLSLQISEGTQLVVRGHLRIDAMELVKIDAIKAQATEAAFTSSDEMLRLSVFRPTIGAGTIETALGSDDQIRRIGIERFGDQFFADVWAVGVCGVDKVDAEFDGAAQDADCFVAISRRSPDAVAGDAHGPEAEAVDGEIPADGEFSGVCDRCRFFGFFLGHCDLPFLLSIIKGERRVSGGCERVAGACCGFTVRNFQRFWRDALLPCPVPGQILEERGAGAGDPSTDRAGLSIRRGAAGRRQKAPLCRRGVLLL